ncbi:ATP-dependent DNA helicase [Trichonephila clavipes]|nr:ATP-dependent DNA helicase [Trichonephila clavipes]
MFLYPSIQWSTDCLEMLMTTVSVFISNGGKFTELVMMGLVTKRTIKAWLQYLVATPLYRMYDVTIDDSCFNLNQSISQVPQEEISENITIEESLTAQQQTLLWNEEKYLRIAPGEANVPRSLLFDEHAEGSSLSQEFTWVILETSGKELELHHS